MNKNKKLMVLTLGAILSTSAFSAFAQTATQAAPAFNPTQIQNELTQSSLEGTTATPPNSGNVFEREVTPLLRETSRKKSLLELKKLDAEIEKVDAEMLKLQQEKLAPRTTRTQGVGNVNIPLGSRIIDASNIANKVVDNPIVTTPEIDPILSVQVPTTPPKMLPQASEVNQLQNKAPVYPQVDNSNAGIRVLMTYGFVDDMYAKITHGNQGGYVIRKGDILPNGKVVVKVTSNYIEVRDKYTKDKEKNKEIKTQKIYVTGAPSEKELERQNNAPVSMPTPSSGQGSSDIKPPNVFGELTIPPMIQSVTTTPAPEQPRLDVTPLTGK